MELKPFSLPGGWIVHHLVDVHVIFSAVLQGRVDTGPRVRATSTAVVSAILIALGFITVCGNRTSEYRASRPGVNPLNPLAAALSAAGTPSRRAIRPRSTRTLNTLDESGRTPLDGVSASLPFRLARTPRTRRFRSRPADETRPGSLRCRWFPPPCFRITTAVCTSCAVPDKRRSIRRASAESAGLPRISRPAATTTVSAASTTPPGSRQTHRTPGPSSRATLSAYARAFSAGLGVSSTSAGLTSNVKAGRGQQLGPAGRGRGENQGA